MIDKVEELYKKGFSIGTYSVIDKGKEYYVACVRINGNSKLDWIEGEKELPPRCFSSPSNAITAAIEYCENYKPSKKKKG